jgi:paraquat-inducible protein B
MNPPPPRISRRPNLPLVWIVPLAALAVGGWMVWREFRHRGPEITIDFAEGAGVEPDKTTLRYKGVAVGTVTAVDLKPDMSGVSVRLRVDKTAAALAREDSRFWIVHPQIGFSGVRGLETLLTGARIHVRPGNGAPATHFQGLEDIPPSENVSAGRAFMLRSDRLGSLSPGAPVFYREVKVGAVETSRLAHDAASVLIRIRVETPYVELVRTNSRFWNTGGASFKVSLLGAEFKTTSLESLFAGGVAFATPEGELAPVAAEGGTFTLSHEADKEWLKWQPRIKIEPTEESPDHPGHSVLPRSPENKS